MEWEFRLFYRRYKAPPNGTGITIVTTGRRSIETLVLLDDVWIE
jgi:hypothetical protein